MKLVAHFDPVTGASGDMILGALIDAGAPVEEIRRQLATLPVPRFRMEAKEVRHRGFRATRLTLEVPDEHDHRHLPEIERLLGEGELSSAVVERARRIFRRLAEAEARTHGISIEKVHFHEVGALDSILDIAGSALALELLEVVSVTFSPLRVGTGEVHSDHGWIPVPAPAVLELVRGIPIVRTSIQDELLTPTGAAILTTLGAPGDETVLETRTVGVSCGARELPDRPNLLRVSIGTRIRALASVPWEEDEVVALETNIDDMSPELIPAILEEALAHGALDAFVTPVLMKKGRPGHQLTVLAPLGSETSLAALLFRGTSTFGVRRTRCPRWKLAREAREIASPWGPVAVKVGSLGNGVLRVVPEYESCRAIANRTGVPLLEVYREVEELIRASTWDAPGAKTHDRK